MNYQIYVICIISSKNVQVVRYQIMTKSIRNRVDLEECEETCKPTSEKPNLDGDRLNVYLLIILYIIQGFPIGLCGALPIILQSKTMVTYEDQVSWNYIYINSINNF